MDDLSAAQHDHEVMPNRLNNAIQCINRILCNSNKQILDFFETDQEEFNRRGVKPVTCVQTAGDVMIIPESWGHGVLNIQESVALATEFKYSTWRIKPAIATIGQVPAFENRAGKELH